MNSITVATLAPFAMVAPGEMVATVKIIPFAAPEAAVSQAVRDGLKGPIGIVGVPADEGGARLHRNWPGRSLRSSTRTAPRSRRASAPLSGTLTFERRCAHDARAVADALRAGDAAGADLLFVFGASAITDRRDVIPAGIERAGGTVLHFGMPVDPGNLLLLGSLNGKPVVGLPELRALAQSERLRFRAAAAVCRVAGGARGHHAHGRGRSPAGNSHPARSRAMPSTRPCARRASPALVLAAGLSSRMGSNKLLAEWRGKPLVRWTVESALASEAKPVIVVTGHESGQGRSRAQRAGRPHSCTISTMQRV